MKTQVSNRMSLSDFCGGIASQADYVFHPEKYHAQRVRTARMPVPPPLAKPVKDSFVQLSEVKMHYLVYGSGKQPLILIHGNACSANALKEAASYLANDYTVYVPESRCHGKSTYTNKISYRLMARDIREFIQALHLEKPIVMGHSDGAINAITLAAEYPAIPGAVISCGANSSPAQFKPFFTLFVKINGVSKDKNLNRLMLTQPHFTPRYLQRITCPVYLISGQFDIMWNADTVYLAKHIRDSKMSVLKREDHSSYIMGNGKKAYLLAHKWLQGIGNNE
ncbi:MAG: alpha/beta hydrolase [Clostridia bacterium]|nr:alpha/beta hydrolase [Clostridia bacterium]